MKRIIVILFVFVPFLSGIAQERSGCSFFLSRFDRLEPAITVSAASMPLEDKPSLQVTMPETRKEFAGIDNGTVFEGSIKNVSAKTIKLNFFRQQILPDISWSSTICLTECYSATVDYLTPDKLVSIDPGQTIPFIFHASVDSINSSDSLIAHVRLEVTNTFPGDTVSYTFIAKSNPSTAVHDEQASISSAKIVSIYPSPLVNGSTIKVTMQSPRETSFTYSIFDAFGRQVAFGSPAHRLSACANTLEIKSLDGLASGSYALKINFTGGGSDARVFQVIQ